MNGVTDVMSEGCLMTLTTKATPDTLPRRGGQGLRAARAMRYAANTPAPRDMIPRPTDDLTNTQTT